MRYIISVELGELNEEELEALKEFDVSEIAEYFPAGSVSTRIDE